ncbi:FAD-dependent oxidoreductase [Chloroflexota bacterium]
MKFENLFQPGKLGGLNPKNRIVMPAMATLLGGEWGEVTDRQIEWYVRRAKGGVGLIIVEVCFAATAIDPIRVNPRPLRADDLCYIPGLACLAEAIHDHGALVGIQISPGAGAQAYAGPWMPGFQNVQKIDPISPSGIPAPGLSNHPRILATEEIEKIVELCGAAARNVQQAGFDLIEIHAHGGYLISQFLSSYFNKRTDKYGGSLDNRCEFLLQIVKAMKTATNPDFPITVKYAIEDFLPDGWDTRQSQVLAQKLAAADVDGIGISFASPETKLSYVPPFFFPAGCFLPYAEKIKEVVNIPLIVGGILKDPQLAEKALKEGKTDFVFEGRALIADPDWPQKVADGRIDEIKPCLSCNECRQSLMERHPLRCAVNAVAGREGEYDSIKPSAVKKRVLVVGGGPAGMEAARVSALKGNDVTLCEKFQELGGLMLLGGVHNEYITDFAQWLVSQMEKLSIDVRLKTELTTDLLKEIQPDAVILANGGNFSSFNVPGIDRDNVFSAKDLLNLMHGIPVKKGILLSALSPFTKRMVTASAVNRMLGSNFPIKKNVAVIGGQFPGCMLALLLMHKGKQVTIIEESDHFGRAVEAHTIAAMHRAVQEGKMQILTSTKVEAITDKGVVTVDSADKKTTLEADSVLVALDLVPAEGNLAAFLKDKVKEVYIIGDAKSFQHIKNAVSEGYVKPYHL